MGLLQEIFASPFRDKSGKLLGDILLVDEGVKGDKPGHPFRGNQWNGGQMQARAERELGDGYAEFAAKLADPMTVRTAGEQPGDGPFADEQYNPGVQYESVSKQRFEVVRGGEVTNAWEVHRERWTEGDEHGEHHTIYEVDEGRKGEPLDSGLTRAEAMWEVRGYVEGIGQDYYNVGEDTPAAMRLADRAIREHATSEVK